MGAAQGRRGAVRKTTMLSAERKDLLVAIAVLALFVGLLVWSEYIPHPEGREFPVLVSSAAVVLCLLDVVAHTDTAIGRAVALILSGEAARSGRGAGHGLRAEAIAIAWIAGATALMVLVGFLVAIPIYVFCYMVVYARRSVSDGAIAALATTICIWAGFELLLSYDLYRGALWPS
jgi:hypothetical protein